MNLNEFGDSSQEDVHQGQGEAAQGSQATQWEPAGDGARFSVDETGSPSSNELLVRQVILEDQELLDKVTLLLDHYPSGIKIITYWPHLAKYLKLPRPLQDIIQASSPHSLAEKLWDHLVVIGKRIREICSALEKIHRDDVKKVIELHIQDPNCHLYDDPIENISIEGTSLIAFLSSKLDEKEWKDLGLKLGVKSHKLKLFGQTNNPSAALLEVLFTMDPHFTLRDFLNLTCLSKRDDIKQLFKNLELVTLKDAINHMAEQDEEKLYARLNQIDGTKNWKDVAKECGVGEERYKALDPQSPKSPTQQLLKWKCNKDPNFSVKELCEKLEKIERNDVRKAISEHLNRHDLYLGLT